MDNKGLAVIGGIIISLVAIGTVSLTLWSLNKFVGRTTRKSSMTLVLEERKLIEDQAKYDANKQFLENDLWLTGVRAASQNAQNGGYYEYEGATCAELPCWSSDIPTKPKVKNQLGKRLNDTYQDNFIELGVAVENNPTLNMDYTNEEIDLYYNGDLNLSEEFLKHNIRGWEDIKTTLPLRYFLLYDKSKDFAQGSEIHDLIFEKINGTPNPTKSKIKNKIESIRENLGDNTQASFDVDEISLTNSGNQWTAELDLKVKVKDQENKRKIPIDGSMKKLAFQFGFEKTVDFTEATEEECPPASSCECIGLPLSCPGVVREGCCDPPCDYVIGEKCCCST